MNLIGWTVLILISNGSYFFLVWLLGLVEIFKQNQSGILFIITIGFFMATYGVYMYFFARGLLALADKLGITIVSNE